MEKDLFEPIRQYFEAQGYTCDGEVRDIDLYMERGEEHAAVELKLKLDFRAVQQAALRQKTVDTVYIGIFMPKNIYSRSFRDRTYLLRRLGIGLLGVSKRTGKVSEILPPEEADLSAFRRRNRKEREAQSREFSQRTLKSNTGGVHQEKLMTGYREDALMVLSAALGLSGKEEYEKGCPAKAVRDASDVARARQILYDNHYGWFTHIGTGLYGVSDAGRAAAEEYREAIEAMKDARADETANDL